MMKKRRHKQEIQRALLRNDEETLTDHMDFEENATSVKHLGIFQTRPEELVLVHRENVSNEPHHDCLR